MALANLKERLLKHPRALGVGAGDVGQKGHFENLKPRLGREHPLGGAPTPSAPLTPNWAGEFHDFQQWVNRASMWLTGVDDSNGSPLSAMCVDAIGRRCANGRDFMRARDEGTFPVRYFWDCESPPNDGAGNGTASNSGDGQAPGTSP